MTRIYPVDGHYDIDLHHVDSGWAGTYASLIRHAVRDILEEGPWSPAEVTLDDGTVLAGTLDNWQDENTFTITAPDELPRIIEVLDVVRFRA